MQIVMVCVGLAFLSLGCAAQTAGDKTSTLAAPPAPGATGARPPRAKGDYTRLYLPGASKFKGRMLKFKLMIDTSGRVADVQLLHGVDRELDRRTTALVRDFEFEPAVDDKGVAARANVSLDLEIVEDEDAPIKAAR